MSQTGKNITSYEKADFANQKFGAKSFRALEFVHESSGSEGQIDFSSLTTPSEWSGESLASPSALIAADIKTNRSKLRILSSARGWLMRNLDYTITDNSRINLLYDDVSGEVFHGIIEDVQRNGVELVDLQNLVVTGTLAEGATTFNIGKEYRVNANSLQQAGEIIVKRSGEFQLRNVNNATADPGADGNYQEIASSGEFGTTIEFNNPGEVGGEPILVFAPGRLIERTSGSLLQELQTLAGQIDAMIPVLSDASGQPESTFQGFPNDADLKSHGDRVLANETRSKSNERLFDPTQLTDAEATKLGLREYNHGDSGLTVSNDAGGETINHGIFIPYQLQDGGWRLRFNIGMTHNSSSSYSVSITGVTFRDNVSFQEVSGSANSAANTMRALASDDSGTINITTSSNSTVTRLFGDVALEEKPTWAA